MPRLSWLPVMMLLPTSTVLASTESVALWQWSIITLFMVLLSVILITSLWYWRKTHRSLLQQQQLLTLTMAQTPCLIAILNTELQLEQNSNSLQHWVPATDDTPFTLPWYLDHTGHQEATEQLKDQLKKHDRWQGRLWLGSEQQPTVILASISRITHQNADKYLFFGQDMAEQWLNHQQQQLRLSRDPLTGLPNATMFDEQLKYAISSCNDRHPQLALLFIKLGFTLTEQPAQMGTDKTELIAAAGRLIRQLVPEQMLLAHYNNDSFVMLVPPHLCEGDCNIRLNRLAHKIIFGTTEQKSATSLLVHIGISIYPTDGHEHSSLCSSAIKAAQAARHTGTNSIQFANSHQQQVAPHYLAIETELYRSAAKGEFDVYFQPQISISSNRVVGYEALLRWHSPKRGILLPAVFMSLADETGLLVSLDRIVFKKVCEQVKYWLQTGLNRGRVTINISTLQFQQADFIHFLQQQLQRNELRASHFELEFSEDIFSQPEDSVQQKLQQLNQLGFVLTLDRFGEGISSLNQLRNFPIHSVKIAQALVRDMEHNEQQRNITASLIRLAGYLQLDVIACGVETEMQAYLLHVMGCDKLQGHLFSKALPANEIPSLLAKENKLFKKAVG